MVLLLHIAVSCISLLYTTLIMFYPSEGNIRTVYGLSAAVGVSGLGLLLSHPSAFPKTCVLGILYVLYVIIAVRKARTAIAGTHT